MNDHLLAQQRAYADLIIHSGINLQPGQSIHVRAELGHREFVRILAAAAYDAGARHVEVLWIDPLVNKVRFQHVQPEYLGFLPEFEVARANRDRYLVAYDRLNRTIELAVGRADPDRLFWPSSPSKGPMDFGDAWKAEGSGDQHMWDVWHAGKSFAAYRGVRPRFASEFGFQSFVSLPTLRRYIEEEDLDIASPAMELHQKNAGGNARIVETISRYFRFPKNFENVVYLSQVQQGLAMTP